MTPNDSLLSSAPGGRAASPDPASPARPTSPPAPVLTAHQAADLRAQKELPLSEATAAVGAAVRERAPFMENDHYISPDMEWARELVHSGRVREIAESRIGKMY